MSKTRTPREVESIIEDLPENFYACRDISHKWDVVNDFYVYRQYQERKGSRSMFVARDFQCERCGSTKREVYLARKVRGLERVATTYDYPAGYLVDGLPANVNPRRIIEQIKYRHAMERVAGASKSDRERGD